jgi:glycine dehydrogenase
MSTAAAPAATSATSAASTGPRLEDLLAPSDGFARRHHGDDADVRPLLAALGQPSLNALIDATVPPAIRLPRALDLPDPLAESAALAELRGIAGLNQVFRSFIGQGYFDTVTPPVIQRAILENPGWYTAYTPYQAEISQGRMEALLNFQTAVIELTGLEIANASLLDEATAAAEAMTLALRSVTGAGRRRFFVSSRCHPQTIDVVVTRAQPLGIEVVLGDAATATFDETYFGALVQYPDTFGAIHRFDEVAERIHAAGGLLVVATDLLALTLLRPPGEFGADVAVGSAQRFGVPLGFGGPHAGFMATRDVYKRQMPGRLIGVSRDAQGGTALRMALGTREQHIRRDKATSNICTAQVLLAVMASMYAVYHGPEGLRRMARRIKFLTEWLAAGLRATGAKVDDSGPFFDTIVSLAVGVLFVSISALVPAEALSSLLLPVLAILAVLVLVVRPVLGFACTIGVDLTWRERAFIGGIAPRGIVAAATAASVTSTLVALKIEGAGELLPATFLVIAGAALVYGLGAAPLASLLKVRAGKEQDGPPGS